MADFEIPENPDFVESVRKFEPTDPAHADLFNKVILALLESLAYLRKYKADTEYVDASYQQGTGYTDKKIADLINGAPETLDTLKELADAITENKTIVEALDSAIGKKANQTELDTHTGNNVIHITSAEHEGLTEAILHTKTEHVTGVKGSAESIYHTGNVEITAENVGAIPAGGNAGSATTVQDYNDTSKKIKVGWVGSALNEDQILAIACYSSGDDDTVKAKIKDVTKDTFKSWLGTVPSADRAARLGRNGNAGYPMTFNWAGKTGQPTWLWGGENGEDMYVYNPSNFSVNYAESAGSVNWAGIKDTPSTYPPAGDSGYYVKNETLTNVNLNNVVKTGVYHLTGTLTNNPINGNATLYVEFDVGTPYQIFIPDYMYVMYKRNYSNGSWGNWQELNTWRPLGTGANDACAGNDSRLSNSRPASDVYAWAKARNKPAYNWNEINNKPTTFNPAAHTHSYLPLAGGTMTGALNMNGNSVKLFGNNYMQANEQDINIIAGGKDMFTGYINARVTSALQVRDTANTAWKPVNALSFNQQSSKRYKKNITDMSEEEARKVLQYRVVDYDYINEADGTNCQGLIAEEVAKICEYPVYRKPDGTIEGLDYSKFVPQLIKMVQIQQTEIDGLRQTIESLKN